MIIGDLMHLVPGRFEPVPNTTTTCILERHRQPATKDKPWKEDTCTVFMTGKPREMANTIWYMLCAVCGRYSIEARDQFEYRIKGFNFQNFLFMSASGYVVQK